MSWFMVRYPSRELELQVRGCRLQVAGFRLPSPSPSPRGRGPGRGGRDWPAAVLARCVPTELVLIAQIAACNLQLATLLLCLGLTGCTTKAKAKAQAQAAYVAGQQEMIMRLEQARQPTVNVIGPVRNPSVPWTEDLTLAKVIVAAGYTGLSAPRQIVIVRAGQAAVVDSKELLKGEDVPLQAGDVVQLRP